MFILQVFKMKNFMVFCNVFAKLSAQGLFSLLLCFCYLGLEGNPPFYSPS